MIGILNKWSEHSNQPDLKVVNLKDLTHFLEIECIFLNLIIKTLKIILM